MTTDTPDAAAVQAAIDGTRRSQGPPSVGCQHQRRAVILAAACEHYQRELSEWHDIHGTENASEVADALKRVRLQRDEARDKLADANAALDRIGEEQTRETEELRLAHEKQLAAALAEPKP